MARTSIIVSAFFLFLIGATTFSQTPGYMSYQGRLTDTFGAPLNGSYDMTFRLYSDSIGGVPLFAELQTGVPVTDGLFSVTIGKTNPLSNDLFTGPIRFLGTQVGADPETTPRIRLTTAPYAFRTASVDGASGGQINGSITVAGTVQSFIGGIIFPDNSVQTVAATGAPTAQTQWISPFWNDQTTANSNIYTFTSIYNASSASNQVTITYYDQAGVSVGQCTQSIAANAVLQAGTANSFVSSPCTLAAGNSGYFTISAQQPVAVSGGVFVFNTITAEISSLITLTFYTP